MSWCPKCKNEYRAGITVCPDCNEELLEELTDAIALEFVPVFHTDNTELKERLVKYLAHCGHKVQEKAGMAENEEGEQVEAFEILVPKDDVKEALQEIRTALVYEAKQAAGEEEDLKPRHRAPEPSTVYVDAKERYQEYKSSGIMFLAFAALFLVFGILNVLGVIKIMASVPSLVIVFGAVIGFTYVGITSLKKVSGLKEEASAEENVTEDILDYLKSEFPKEAVEKITPTGATADELTGEELYFVRIAEIKNYVMSEYPDKDENYLDALIEDYYNSLDL